MGGLETAPTREELLSMRGSGYWAGLPFKSMFGVSDVLQAAKCCAWQNPHPYT